MESLTRARARLRAYPRLLAACSTEGAAYARCVALKEGEAGKGECEKEFVVFRRCVQDAAKRLGTRY
ncbi:NADH dehydrogenase [ubiquinone] 1 alpha subcomplex assembly factor 8 [Amphibalanus amphitrite]|uniref:NADH dehydrogenase [ubiquinone] 1 alpha subcomplex assembly factor 8 n=1 Tax=Amphibalanus amphitrite TaxID=1232801 RepID=A0A6A4XBG2_AMPAM|nr:NADH dehydrogenase [ubiquinone] 1 alpha subcomplex assembly factor 8 [Amphibalanus amphitrite]